MLDIYDLMDEINDNADKWAKNRWLPQWLAFYQTKVDNVDLGGADFCSAIW
jgi:hypothetical protein